MKTSSKPELLAATFAPAIAALTALLAYARWPYAYYEVFHLLICGASLWATYLLRSRPIALAVSIGVAVFFNPIVPFRMPAHQWQHLDLAAFIAMGSVAVYAWRNRLYLT